MSGQQKSAGTSAFGTSPPAWATPGSQQYSNMNTMLQTAPMASALNTLGTGGQGAASQIATNSLLGMNGTNQTMNTGVANIENASNGMNDYASGKFLNPSTNPYLQNIINTSNQDVADQVNQLYGAGGRYGSGYNQAAVARAVGENTSNLLNQNFNTQQGLQLQALGQQGQLGSNLGSIGNSIYGNQVGSLTGAANLENIGQQNVLNTISQLPTIQNNKVFDATQQMQAGNTLDQYTQTGLNNLIKQWTQQNNEPWTRLGGLIAAEQGAAGPYGTMQGTSNTSTSNPLKAVGAMATLMGK